MAPLRSRAKQSRSKAKKEVTNIVDVNEDDSKPGCIYIGHIPHGFFEDQMRSYFSQFGIVLAVRICRSKKTGGSRGYGFVKFRYAAVAKTVAETCNNYLFFNKLLRCQYKPLTEVHRDTFKKFTWQPKRTPKRQYNSAKTEDQMKKSMKSSISKAQKKLNSFKKLGLDVDLNDIMDVPSGITLNVAPVQKSSEKNESESTPAEPAEPASKKRKVVISNSPSVDSQLPKISPRRLRSAKVEEATTKASEATTATKTPAKKTKLKEKSPVQSPKLTRPLRKSRKIVK